MRWVTRGAFAAVVSLGLVNGTQSASAQVLMAAPETSAVTVAALTAPELARANDLITRMVQSRELIASDVRDDVAVPGRRHETYRQFYRGVPVEGSSVTRQMAGSTTVSAFGTIHTGIAIDVTPSLTPTDASRVIEREAGRPLAFGIAPVLVILPSPLGSYALTYRATVADAVTYYVDALSGDVIKVVDEKKDDVGVGTGALGDTKKMATTSVGGTFRTRDTLRPAGISTFDTGGNTVIYDRLINTGVSSDGDLASDSDNTWTDGRIVDAHVHTGWTYDYFFKRHNWAGLDGLNRPMSDIVHRAVKNNAAFIPPPFGPGQHGAMVYGETTAGLPMTALDIAGHELTHGVTYFSMVRRTGQPLFDSVFVDGFGPATFTSGGQTFSCDTTVLIDGNGVSRPFVCDAGRYVLASTHGGAVNEALSDILGTSVEFFNQPPGSGLLKADYLMAEDVANFGPIRSLSNPASLLIGTDTGTVPYPDHRSKEFLYTLVVVQGTRENPSVVAFAPIAFVNGAQVLLLTRGADSGGVHWNSTVFSHAFYLAIEGGKNATSGLSVTGVGASNRALVERVFFRAITQLMPNSPSQATAALAVYQAAVDLYGVNSATATAIGQAMVAVGLLVAN